MRLQKNKKILLILVAFFSNTFLILGGLNKVQAQPITPPNHDLKTNKNEEVFLSASKFYFEAEGIGHKFIKEFSGLSVGSAPSQEFNGSSRVNPRNDRATPKNTKVTTLTLKLIATSDLSIYRWYDANKKNSSNSNPSTKQLKNASIIAYDQAAKMQARWEIKNCYPIKYTVSNVTESSNNFTIETIVLIHEGVERVEAK